MEPTKVVFIEDEFDWIIVNDEASGKEREKETFIL